MPSLVFHGRSTEEIFHDAVSDALEVIAHWQKHKLFNDTIIEDCMNLIVDWENTWVNNPPRGWNITYPPVNMLYRKTEKHFAEITPFFQTSPAKHDRLLKIWMYK